MKITLALPLLLGLVAVAVVARELPKQPAVNSNQPPAVVPVEPAPVRYAMADCHLHLVDFLQRTDGARAALNAMTASGVTDAVVSGMPVVKQWSESEPQQPQYYLEDDARCYWYLPRTRSSRVRSRRCQNWSANTSTPSSAASMARIAMRWIIFGA
jgi:hypothetical protein